MSIQPVPYSSETKLLHVALTVVRKDWLWRLFEEEETGFYHLYNLAKLEAFGYETKETDGDNKYPNRYLEVYKRYEWVENQGMRQMSKHDLEYVPDSNDDPEAYELWTRGGLRGYLPVHVRIHCADDDDREVTEDISLFFQDDDEDARYFEEAGYWTVAPLWTYVPEEGPEERSLDDLLSPLSVDLTTLYRVTPPMASKIDSMHAILQSLSLGRSTELAVDKVDATPDDTIARIRAAMKVLGIFDLRGAVDAKDAVRILNHFEIKIAVHSLKNSWIKEGRIAHHKPGDKYRIPLTSLAEIIENDGPCPKDTYESLYTPDPKKKPRKHR